MTSPNTMHAWLYSSASGGLDKAIKQHDDAPQPTLKADEVLVRVHAMSLNPIDYKLPEGLGVASRVVIPTPAAPGLDFAGVVSQVGPGTLHDKFREGERVMGRVEPNKFGTLGEYIVAKWDGLVALPETIGMEDGSCVGTVGLTAWQSIAPNVIVGQDDKVFINGGSGGTGTFCIQIAKALGCHVTASCSGKNVDFCKSLGADDVIDYTSQNVTETLAAQGQVFKLVVDNVGSSPADLYKAADKYLVADGKFVQVGAGMSFGDIKTMMGRMLVPSFLGGGKRKMELIMCKNNHQDLAELAKLIGEGKLKPVIDQVFEYQDAPKAIQKLKLGRSRGKIVVKGVAAI